MRKIACILGMVCVLTATSAFADAIKDRMKARKPSIVSMKRAEAVGESHGGYLVDLGSAKASVLKAENDDRYTVYVKIAKSQGSSPEQVGKRRAKSIAKSAKPGTWLQAASGEWYKK